MLKPNNPIKTIEELESLKGQRIYGVHQSGHMNDFICGGLTSFNDKNGFNNRHYDHWGWENNTYISEDKHTSGGLRDVNIGGGGWNKHHLFANKGDADDYSKQMKTDPEYIQSVKDHHARCGAEWGYRDD